MNKDLNHYTYRDYSTQGMIIFECDAENIVIADKLYEKKFGKHPSKQSEIGCNIIFYGNNNFTE